MHFFPGWPLVNFWNYSTIYNFSLKFIKTSQKEKFDDKNLILTSEFVYKLECAVIFLNKASLYTISYVLVHIMDIDMLFFKLYILFIDLDDLEWTN